MDIFLSRYRNLSVLLVLVVAQLLLLAWQVKGDHDARLLRIWAVTAVTPLAKATDWARGGTGGFLDNYVRLRDAADQNQRLRGEVAQLRLENHFLRTQISDADRAKALLAFKESTPSKTLPARVIATSTTIGSRVVFVDRGSRDGVRKGMAAIRPEGIVGKVVAAYPTASLVMLATEQGFAAGVVSQKNRVRGTMRGLGSANCSVDYVENEEKVELGEWFYTTGDDRIFPKGLPAGMAVSVKEGRGSKEIVLEPAALKGGVEEVLLVLEGVHSGIPEPDTPSEPGISILPPPPSDTSTQSVPAEGQTQAAPAGIANPPSPLTTDADRLKEKYRRIGESQSFVFGTTYGRAPDFNRPPAPKPAAAPPAAPATQPGSPSSQTTPQPQSQSPPPDPGAAESKAPPKQ